MIVFFSLMEEGYENCMSVFLTCRVFVTNRFIKRKVTRPVTFEGQMVHLLSTQL